MSKLKLLITARDVGATINLIEIVKLAQIDPIYELTIYAQQPAANYFSNAEIPYTLVNAEKDDLLTIAHSLIQSIKPDAVLCGLSTPGDGGLDEAIIKVSKGAIPSFVMQDFWGEVNDFFGECADYYLCLDAEAKILTEQKFATTGIVIGSPRHACYSDLKLPKKIPSSKKTIGLFGQSLHHIPGYQETLRELFSTLQTQKSKIAILYRQHPRETAQQANITIELLKQSGLEFKIVAHQKVEDSLILSDVVISILSNCLYDAAYLNFFSPTPYITPLALCYKPDILRHLESYNMIAASPYKQKGIAVICNQERPSLDMLDYWLSEDCQQAVWRNARDLSNPCHASQLALRSICEAI